MRPIEKTSEDLFQKLRSRFSPITLGDENAESTADPKSAKIFNFMYKEGDNDIGYVSISLNDNRALKVYYGGDVIENMHDKNSWYSLLRDLRGFAKRNLMAFDARDLAKNQLEPRDFKFISQQDGSYKDHEVEVTESTMFGSRRKSYQTVESVKMIVNHRRSIDETIPGARSRYIESIYLENADGERFKFPYNYLTGARAMARHVSEGGTPYDGVGKHILETIKEMRDLSKFARRTKKHAMENADASSVREHVIERFQSLKKTLGAMSVKEGYARFVENFSTEETLAEDDTIQQLKERFTQQVFDTQLEDTLPAVMRAIKEAEMRQVSEADSSVEKMIKNKNWPLVLRRDDAADSLFKSTKFTDGKGLLGFILSDIASRAIGDDADAVANFASDAAERVQDREYDARDKQLAMMLAKRYMDDVKQMSADPSYAEMVRMDPKDIYGAKKKRKGGFHEAEALEAWANDLVPENDVKKKSDAKVREATTQGTTGTTGTAGAPGQKPNPAQMVRDPKLQQAAKNVSRVAQAAGIKSPPQQIAQTMAAQAAGKMPNRQGMMTVGGLGNTIMQAAASDPRKAAQLTAMMKKMVTQGRFDEDAARQFLEDDGWFDSILGTQSPMQKYVRDPLVRAGIASPGTMSWKDGKSPYKEPATVKNMAPSTGPVPRNITGKNAPVGYFDADNVKTDPKTNTTTVFKDPGSDAAGSGYNALYGKPVTPPDQVKPVTPLPKSDLSVSQMPDMDAMVGQQKAAAANAQGTSAFTGMPTRSAPPAPRISVPTIPANTGTAKANTPVGSMPAAKIPSIPANAGAAKANTPVGSMPAAPLSGTVAKGSNVWNTFKSQFGRSPTAADLKTIAQSSGIKDINKVMPGQKLDFSKIK